MCSCTKRNLQLNSNLHIPQRKIKNGLIKSLATLFSLSLFQENLLECYAKLIPADSYADELAVVYSKTYVTGLNCSPPTIKEFPSPVFSQEYRERGVVILHLLITFYVFYAFAIVCGDYFIPSVNQLSQDLQMESDIAGATLMGIATSSPELFTNVVGTFIMKGDMGVGAVVGSAGFNLLIVTACIGFDMKDSVKLEWWPLTRDMFYYGLSVIALFAVMLDESIQWWEALVLLVIYALYIYGMFHDALLQSLTEKILRIENSDTVRMQRRQRKREHWSLENTQAAINEFNSSRSTIITVSESVDRNESEEPKSTSGHHDTNGRENIMRPCSMPHGEGALVWLQWIAEWPIRILFTVTIPNCRNFRRIYPLSFIMSTIWIGILSYLGSWMMTIVGHTFRIPDTVFGVSIFAAGTSVPEVVSSVIVARKGLGTMAVSNSIGSNTFDILICLGIPWLIRALIDSEAKVYSTSLLYTTGMLMFTLLFMYIILAFNKFLIDKKVAAVSLALYLFFLTVDAVLELNVFFFVNMPVCETEV